MPLDNRLRLTFRNDETIVSAFGTHDPRMAGQCVDNVIVDAAEAIGRGIGKGKLAPAWNRSAGHIFVGVLRDG